MKKYFKYIYSDSLNEMVVREFTYKNKKYEWDDLDLVYYNVDSDEDYFQEVPKGAEM